MKVFKKGKKQMYMPTLVLAAALFLYAASMGAPRILVSRASTMLGSAVIGATASVEPNPYNTLAQQLVTKQDELSVREKELALREGQQFANTSSNLPLYSLMASLALTFLVTLNFYFDWRRSNARPSAPTQQIIKIERRG